MTDSAEKSALSILKWPLLALLLGLIAGTLFVSGSYAYLQYEKRLDVTSRRNFQDAQARLSNASQEAEDLRASFDTYQSLRTRGVLRPETRLDWIETANRLKTKYQIMTVDYELSPQRTAPLPGNATFPSVDLLGTRIKLKLATLHEGDALGFLQEVAALREGFRPFERCSMKTLPAIQGPGLTPRIETECVFDWITIRDKRADISAASGAVK
jgi:hypothetical protein